MRGQLNQRINALVGNFRRLIAVNRNLSFFTTGYNYMIQLIPALFVAPLFIDGHADFGIIGQSAMAFSTLLGAFSLVVTQFQAISSYASVATRLSEFTDAMEQKAVAADERAEGIVFDRLTLVDEANGTVLVRELEGTVRPGRHLLVTGPQEVAKLVLFRSLAGLARPSAGSIRRPSQTVTAFLAEQPYLPPLTLRGLLMPHGAVSDEDILTGARELEMEEWMTKAGGLEASADWDDELAFPDRQMLLVLRALLLRPAYLFLDHLDLALGRQREARVLNVLADRGVTCVSFAPDGTVPSVHREVLVLQPDGSWQWTAVPGDPAGGLPGGPA
jgi:putative ATP-binding cassette transporter